MKDDERRHPLRDAHEDRTQAEAVPDTPQTRAPAYRLAFNDNDFMCRDELRPVRLQLELLKPEMLLDEQGSRFYDETREFARLMTLKSMESGGKEDVVVTGGGPGVILCDPQDALFDARQGDLCLSGWLWHHG